MYTVTDKFSETNKDPLACQVPKRVHNLKISGLAGGSEKCPATVARHLLSATITLRHAAGALLPGISGSAAPVHLFPSWGIAFQFMLTWNASCCIRDFSPDRTKNIPDTTIQFNHPRGWGGKPTGSQRDSRVAEISHDIRQPGFFHSGAVTHHITRAEEVHSDEKVVSWSGDCHTAGAGGGLSILVNDYTNAHVDTVVGATLRGGIDYFITPQFALNAELKGVISPSATMTDSYDPFLRGSFDPSSISGLFGVRYFFN